MQEIGYIEQGSLSSKEIDAFVYVLKLAGGKLGQNWTSGCGRKSQEGAVRVQSADKSIASLESIGVKIDGVDEASVSTSKKKKKTYFNCFCFNKWFRMRPSISS